MNVESSTIQEKIARLSELSSSNPELFELERKMLIEHTIAGFPEHWRRRAYGMQFCLDAKLSLAKDPVSRMNLMVELFWNQVMDFSNALTDPEDYQSRKKRNPAPGNPIPLRPSQH
jgi:hypothetical protein